MTRRFRKTTLIEAVETYKDENDEIAFKESPKWLLDAFVNGKLFKSGREHTMKIKTLEGTVVLKPGSWVAQGVNGEIWPIDAEVFAKSYEEVYEY